MKSLENTLERFSKTSEFTNKISTIGKIKSFNFERGLKSKKIPKIYFTNLAKTPNDETYDITLKYYNYHYSYTNRNEALYYRHFSF